MPEALTESFCERCGTRYEFAAPTKLNTLRKTRGLISGLRNYVMSQDALSDAVGDAMRSEEETLAARQLEAFHESFNFCINCRQYTCVNCWNDDAGRCRTCVPIPGTDDLIERFEASFHAQHPGATLEEAPEMASDDLSRRLGIDSWPSEDLSAAPSNGHAAADWPEAELVAGAYADADAQAELETAAAVDAEPEFAPGPEPEPEVAFEPVAAEVEPEAAPLAAFTEPDVDEAERAIEWELDAAFALEPEPVAAEVELTFEPEAGPAMVEGDVEQPIAAPEPTAAEAEPDVAFEPEAEPEPEPEPVAGEAEPEPPQPAPRPITPITETILRIPRPEPVPLEDERVAAEADDPALAARRAKLDLLGLGDPGEGPVSAGRPNVMPYRSRGASVHPAELAARGTAAGQGSFWEASAREVAGVASHVAVQSCSQCGLSLSASARFCRRCGTRQARSA